MGEAIKLKPGVSDAYFLRGSALLSLGRLEDALSCLDCTLALNPDFPEALLNRAATLFGLRRHAEAGKDYNRLLRLRAIAAGLRLGKRVVAPFDTKALSLSVAGNGDAFTRRI
jgi:tetratricopeptide (TPR) repeat protein